MSSTLHENLARLAGDESWRQGLRLFREGAVLDVTHDGRSVEVRLATDAGGLERTRITFGGSRLVARCTCKQPRAVCEHAVASLLQMAEECPAELGPLLHGSAAATGTAGGTPDVAASPSELAAALAGNGVGPQREDITRSLGSWDDLAQLRVVLLRGRQPLDSRWSRTTLRIRLAYHGREYAPSNVRRLVQGGVASGGMQFAVFTPQQQQVMRFLVRHAEHADGAFSLGAYETADLFHCLAGYPDVWDEDGGTVRVCGERLEAVLEASASGGAWSLVPRILLPGRGALCGDHVRHIVGRGGYWIGVDGQYWWLAGVFSPRWLEVFLKGDVVELDAAQFSRLESQSRGGWFPARVAIAEGMAQLAARPVKGRPIVFLDWQKGEMVATVEFEYDGRRVTGASPSVLWGRNRFVRRNERAERQVVSRLKGLGFKVVSGRRGRLRLRGATRTWRFIHEGLNALPPAWRVFTSREFQRCQAATGMAALQVQAGAENGAWFEVSCSLSGPAGSDVPLSVALQAALDERELVLTDDGVLVRLSAEIRRALKLLAERAQEQRESAFRFGRHCAVPIGVAVDPFWRGRTPDWQRLRARLAAGAAGVAVRFPDALAKQLRGYQKEGVSWLRLLDDCGMHGILADEMGLGKTIQALAAIALRAEHADAARPALVICPTSLVENWLVEAARFVPGLRAVGIRGSSEERAAQVARLADVDLAVTSYALLRRDIDGYRKHYFGTVVLDEAQHIKNPRTANARTCKELRADHRLILTGTPLENSLYEMWSLFDFLLPGLLGSHCEFQEHYEVPAKAGEQQRAAAELAEQIRPFVLRRTKAQVCAELPPKIEQTVFCELTPEQETLYAAILAAGRDVLRDARGDRFNRVRFELLALLMRLRQVCCHPLLLPEELRRNWDTAACSAKTELAKEILLEALDDDHRVLFFSQFTGVLAMFRRWLDQEQITYEYLDGSTKDRQARVDRFNSDSGISVFLLSLRAGGTGLNLTGADTVLHYDQWWNPMVEDQATDRSHRIGQTRPVTSFRLVARHTIEERILALQQSKRELFRQLMDGVPTDLRDLTADDMQFLLARD